MKEIWKDIRGYEGLYQVSSLGQIKSIKRLCKSKSGNQVFPVRERILHQSKNTWGYSQVTLYSDGKKINFPVHRIVAEAFIQNPNSLPEVNHKNECKADNRADNLEWCTRKYNDNYGTRNYRSGQKRSRPVAQYDLQGNKMAVFKSAREATQNTGFDYKHISDCCLGRRQTHGHYQWKFEG